MKMSLWSVTGLGDLELEKRSIGEPGCGRRSLGAPLVSIGIDHSIGVVQCGERCWRRKQKGRGAGRRYRQRAGLPVCLHVTGSESDFLGEREFCGAALSFIALKRRAAGSAWVGGEVKVESCRSRLVQRGSELRGASENIEKMVFSSSQV